MGEPINTSRSIDSLRGLPWCFGLIAAWAPLFSMHIGSTRTRVIASGIGWALLIAGLQGVRVVRADAGMTRLAGWLLVLAWIGAIGNTVGALPPWAGAPSAALAVFATVHLAVAVGVGLLIRRVAALCAEATLKDLAQQWRHAGWICLALYTGWYGFTAVSAWGRVVDPNVAAGWVAPRLVASMVWIVGPVLLGTSAAHLAWAIRMSGDRCPQCGYSRRGLREDRCPECGAVSGLGVMSGGAGAVTNVPRPSPRWGRLLIAPCAAALLLTSAALWMSPGGPSWAWRHTWMLIRDGQMTERIDSLTGFDLAMAKLRSASTAKRARVFTQEADTAQRELSTRFTAKKLTPEHAKKVAAAALKVQQDADGPSGLWPDLFAEAYAVGVVGREDLDRFLVGSVRFKLRPRTIVALGDPIPFEIAWEWRGPSLAWASQLPTADRVLPAIRIDLKRITLNGVEVGAVPDSGSYITVAGNAGEGAVEFTNSRVELRAWDMPMASGIAGNGLLEVEAVAVLSGPGGAMVTKLREGNVGYESARTLKLSSDFHLVDPAETITTRVTMPDMRADIAERYSATLLDRDRKGQLMLQTPSNVVQAMDEVAFEVILIAEGQGFPAGSLSVGGRSNRSYWLEVGEEAMAACRRSAPDQVRVVLRPSDAAARRTVRAMKILEGGDIEIGPVEMRGRY